MRGLVLWCGAVAGVLLSALVYDGLSDRKPAKWQDCHACGLVCEPGAAHCSGCGAKLACCAGCAQKDGGEPCGS